MMDTMLLINSISIDEVNVISQLNTNLNDGTKEYQTIILIQNGVPLDLLLSTNVLAKLRLHVADSTGHKSMIELLQAKTWEPRFDLLMSQLRIALSLCRQIPLEKW